MTAGEPPHKSLVNRNGSAPCVLLAGVHRPKNLHNSHPHTHAEPSSATQAMNPDALAHITKGWSPKRPGARYCAGRDLSALSHSPPSSVTTGTVGILYVALRWPVAMELFIYQVYFIFY